MHWDCRQELLGAGDDTGPYAWTLGTLLTKPSPQPIFIFSSFLFTSVLAVKVDFLKNSPLYTLLSFVCAYLLIFSPFPILSPTTMFSPFLPSIILLIPFYLVVKTHMYLSFKWCVCVYNIDSLLPTYGSQGSNSDCQVLQHEPLLSKSSCPPKLLHFLLFNFAIIVKS